MSEYLKFMNDQSFEALWHSLRPRDLGRFITPDILSNNLMNSALSHSIGSSEEGRPLRMWKWGNGPVRIAAWSQMHGNESTGTRALELLRSVFEDQLDVNICKLESRISFFALPMINPDGARLWTRRNAFGVDINRDALAQQSAEARLLSRFLSDVNPHLCLNLHDQRSLFRRGDTAQGSELSIAVPQCTSIDSPGFEGRARAIQWVEQSFTYVNSSMSNRMSRFDEAYYPRAFGEWAQNKGLGAVLLESGVGALDFDRHESLKLLFKWMLAMLFASEGAMQSPLQEFSLGTSRLALPENREGLFDRLDRSARIEFSGRVFVTDLGWRRTERLKGDSLYWEWELEEIGDLAHAVARELFEDTHFQIYDHERLHPGLRRSFDWNVPSDGRDSMEK